MIFDTVIGLEVHVQLKTKSKLFSGAAIEFGAPPNSQVSFIDAGFPGVLPVLNQEAVRMAIQFGLSINGTIHNRSYFERKNYFYPDLPKGYQISQFQCPIVSNGYLSIELSNGEEKKIPIMRAHLEEDAGKLLHPLHSNYTSVDLNRAGIPLLEIVTPPCLYSAEEAIQYLKTLHQLVRFLGICDGNMQEGSLRCDVNLSLRPKGSIALGTRTEIKNLNSFRFIEKAILYEQNRHQTVLEKGGILSQETRLYSPESQKTVVLRSKEDHSDYRYFPDPDLLPIAIEEKEIQAIAQSLPPLPEQIKKGLQNNPALNNEDIYFILSEPGIYYVFESIKQDCIADEKTIINWLKGPYAKVLNEAGFHFEDSPLLDKHLKLLLNHLARENISYQQAKQIFDKVWKQALCLGTRYEIDIEKIVNEEYQNVLHESDLEKIIEKTVQKYPQQASEYRNGKEKLLAFFIGAIMKDTRGQANPGLIKALLIKNLMR